MKNSIVLRTIGDEQNNLISLRPHHLERFIKYSSGLSDPTDGSKDFIGYGEEYFLKVRKLFDFINLGGTGREWIMIENDLDSICDICPIKKEMCSDPEPISPNFKQLLKSMDINRGFLYPIKEFSEKVRNYYNETTRN